jgi:zinc transporter 1/2/3
MYARGILNAFATGNLVYVALVEMIAEDMNTVAVQSSWRLKIAMVVSLCVGAAALAVLAIWA